KTLAARGISGLGDMLRSHAERAPLGRNVDVAEVGSTGVFLPSDASSGITGEVIYVDCGYNIMGFEGPPVNVAILLLFSDVQLAVRCFRMGSFFSLFRPVSLRFATG